MAIPGLIPRKIDPRGRQSHLEVKYEELQQETGFAGDSECGRDGHGLQPVWAFMSGCIPGQSQPAPKPGPSHAQSHSHAA